MISSTDPLPFKPPQTLDEVNEMIALGIAESIHLDYKASAALMSDSPNEISKDVSSFANSDGGVVVYGVTETGHKPGALDEGVDHKKRSREWLEDKIQSNVSPRLDGLRIAQIQLNDERSLFVVSVPRSDRGPHQDRVSHRYYKRHNFKSAPMEDYEIQDVRNRRAHLLPLISVRIDVVQGAMLEFCVENVGDVPATEIKFAFAPELVWQHGTPPVLLKGARSLLPGKKLSFLYGTGPQVFEPASKVVRDFSVEVSYFHSAAQKTVTDRFDIDLSSLEHSLQERTELERHSAKLETAIAKLVAETKKINEHLARLERIAGPTGLTLSYSTTQTLARLFGVDAHPEPLNPDRYSWQGFQEILGVDSRMAINLHQLFIGNLEGKKLVDLDGMTPELLAIIKDRFRVDPGLLDP